MSWHILIFQLQLSRMLSALPYIAQQICFGAGSVLFLFITGTQDCTIKHAVGGPHSVAPMQHIWLQFQDDTGCFHSSEM